MAYDGMEIGLLGLSAFSLRALRRLMAKEQIDAENHTRTMPVKHDQPPSYLAGGVSRQHRRQLERQAKKQSKGSRP